MCCLSEGGERETSTRPGCRWFQRPLSLGPDPITLASFPPDWRQFVGPGSESDVEAASDRSREMSSFSMSFLIEERETLLGDVSIEVVNEESSVDSRNLHCRTSSSGSTPVTASERKVRALRGVETLA